MTSVPLGTRQHCPLVAYLKARSSLHTANTSHFAAPKGQLYGWLRKSDTYGIDCILMDMHKNSCRDEMGLHQGNQPTSQPNHAKTTNPSPQSSKCQNYIPKVKVIINGNNIAVDPRHFQHLGPTAMSSPF